MGYTNCPNNLVHKLFKHASKSGVDVFRVSISLNYIDNLKLKSGHLSGLSDIYTHGVTGGGQYTNLLLQYKHLGLI